MIAVVMPEVGLGDTAGLLLSRAMAQTRVYNDVFESVSFALIIRDIANIHGHWDLLCAAYIVWMGFSKSSESACDSHQHIHLSCPVRGQFLIVYSFRLDTRLDNLDSISPKNRQFGESLLFASVSWNTICRLLLGGPTGNFEGKASSAVVVKQQSSVVYGVFTTCRLPRAQEGMYSRWR